MPRTCRLLSARFCVGVEKLEGLAGDRYAAGLEVQPRRVDLERAVLVVHRDSRGVDVVGEPERLLETLVKPEGLAIVSGQLALIPANGDQQTYRLDRQLVLGKVRDVEIDDVLVRFSADARAIRELVAPTDDSHGGHRSSFARDPPISGAKGRRIRERP
jgi:hypothetical protein